VVALLFGSGQADGTCACDAARDGATNPPPNGTATRESLSADDDGGYFRARVRAYYAAGAMALPAATRRPSRKRASGVPARVRNPGRFSMRARTSRKVVRRGGSVRIRAAVRPTRSQRALVSIEVYRDGTQVFQRYFDHAVLRRGRARAFSARWRVGEHEPAGRYVVKVGVFAPGFDGLRAWNDDAARLRVA
jgi:hypothetical protein